MNVSGKHSYTEGIRIAWEEGHIHRRDPEEEFRWQHDHLTGTINAPKLGSVSSYYGNGKKIHEPARKLLQLLIDRGYVEESTKYLDVGSGAGVAAYEAHTLLHPHGGKVETINLTPVNPYLGIPRGGMEDILNRSREAVRALGTLSGELQSRISELLRRIDSGQLQAVEELRSITGAAIYDLLSDPYIAQQWIGTFPQETKPPGQFDIIYESCGGLRYSISGDSYQGIAFKAAGDLLSPRGILMAHAGSDVRPWFVNDVLRDVGLGHYTKEKNLYVLVRPENPFYKDATQLVENEGEHQCWMDDALGRILKNHF